MSIPIRIHPADEIFASHLAPRLKSPTPAFVDVMGKLDLLKKPLTAFFCSAKCPGEAILRTYDIVSRWRDEGRIVAGGFHSPVEQECLRILLRGNQPIVICPARTLHRFRIPAEWRSAWNGGRLLLLSPFSASARRATARLALIRNEFVAALADDIVFAHTTPGGHMDRLTHSLTEWRVPFSTLHQP